MSILKICKNSLAHMNTILRRTPPNKWIRINATNSVCNDIRYEIHPTIEEPEQFDKILQEKVPIYICGKSLPYIIGLELRWIEDVYGARIRFQFKNMT
jgi:Fe-S cluster assembly iron-binding protein IscA